MLNSASSSSNSTGQHAAKSRIIATVSENARNSGYTEHMLKMVKERLSDKNLVAQLKFPFMHSVSVYDKVMKIGQGTFGEVHKARCTRSNKLVALKKILMENEREGFPITAIREIRMLQKCSSSKYITELIEICNSNNPRERTSFYLVFSFFNFDLVGLLSHRPLRLELADIKTMMKHILSGLDLIHSLKILHRDMKTANVLVSIDGYLKLADFGLSRQMWNVPKGRSMNYTNRVVTLWYRPPELLLGSRRYDTGIDMWGAGCIMAELWTRTPILQAETEQRQLEVIQKLCGGINREVWPTVDQLPLYRKVELQPNLKRQLREKMSTKCVDSSGKADKLALDLLDKLLCLDPAQRINAETALDDALFFSAPLPPDDIRHITRNLPENLFEFTAGKGAHAKRRPNGPMPGVVEGGPPAHKRARGWNEGGQLQDIIF